MSSYRSSLPLLWIIEYLASFQQVPVSILHDLVERLPELPDDYGKSTREMVALRCLEELFGPRNGLTNEVLPEARVGFDYSETCEDVLQSILKEISASYQGKAGPERLKWDIQFFLMHKRANMKRCALEKLKDVIAYDNHPDAAALEKKSGLMQVDDSKTKTVHVCNWSSVSGRCSLRVMDPQGVAIQGDLVPIKKFKDSELQDGMLKGPVLSTKRHKNDLAAGSSGILVGGHGDMLNYGACHPNAKKLRLDATAVDNPVGRTSLDQHANRTLEDSEMIVSVSEVESCLLTQACQTKDNSDQGIASDVLRQENKYQEVEFQDSEMESFPSNVKPCDNKYTQCTQVDKAGHAEPKATIFEPLRDKKNGFSDESPKSNGQNIHIKSQDPLSAERAQQVYSHEATGGMEDPHDEERLGHGDEFENDYFNLALQKESFLSSLMKSNQNPLSKESWTDQNLCVKCNINRDTLVCSTDNCPLVVHRCCMPSAASFDDKGHFYCPFCAYSSSISEYLRAKKKVSNARKELANFIGMCFGPFPKELNVELGKELGHSSPTGKLNHPAGTNGNEHLQEDEQNETNQTSLLQKVVEDKLQSGSSSLSSRHDSVPCPGEQEKETRVREGMEKVGQKCPSVEETQLMQDQTLADPICDNGQPFTVNNETAVQNKGEVEGRMYEKNLLSDSFETSEKPVNNENVVQDQGEVEGRMCEQNVLPDSRKSSEKPVCAVNNESDETSDADNYKFIISRYSIRSRRRKAQYTYPATPQLRRNKIRWTTEEEEILKKGVQRFVGTQDGTIPWKKILEFGASVFLDGRTTVDLKDKWRNMCKCLRLEALQVGAGFCFCPFSSYVETIEGVVDEKMAWIIKDLSS